jgi:hypothetical protein
MPPFAMQVTSASRIHEFRGNDRFPIQQVRCNYENVCFCTLLALFVLCCDVTARLRGFLHDATFFLQNMRRLNMYDLRFLIPYITIKIK